ncbi:hypothetical protein ACWIG4_30390 [Streptomyces sp. NPDC002248]
MRYVLVKMGDEAAEKFVRKAGPKAVGIWEIPDEDEVCTCSDKVRNQARNWTRDTETGWFICRTCEGVSKPFLSVKERLYMALGRNRIMDFTGKTA